MATTTVAPSSSPTVLARRRSWVPGLTLGVPVVVLVTFVLLPLVMIAIYSFYSLNADSGLMQRDFTWGN